MITVAGMLGVVLGMEAWMQGRVALEGGCAAPGHRIVVRAPHALLGRATVVRIHTREKDQHIDVVPGPQGQGWAIRDVVPVSHWPGVTLEGYSETESMTAFVVTMAPQHWNPPSLMVALKDGAGQTLSRWQPDAVSGDCAVHQ